MKLLFRFCDEVRRFLVIVLYYSSFFFGFWDGHTIQTEHRISQIKENQNSLTIRCQFERRVCTQFQLLLFEWQKKRISKVKKNK